MSFTHFDIHSHLNFPQYDDDRDDVIARMKEQGVGTITVGTNLEMSMEAVELAENHDNLWACVGVHPQDADDETNWTELERLARHSRTVAIGETGFDFFRPKENPSREIQESVFRRHVALARDTKKPLMLHLRDGKKGESAYDVALDILETEGDVVGNAHFFAGSLEQAKRFLNCGFTLSFTGVITFARDYDEIIRFVPSDLIHAETDAPFVAPEPYRGKRNEPIYVIKIAQKLAEIRREKHSSEQLVSNTKSLFGIE